MSRYFKICGWPIPGGRIVTAQDADYKSLGGQYSRIDQALVDLYSQRRLPDDYFADMRLSVTAGKDVALLHNMVNFCICRKDIAFLILELAGTSLQLLPVLLHAPDLTTIDNYVVLNPLSDACIDVENTDASWVDGKKGGEVIIYYFIVLRESTISSPIFRIRENVTEIAISNDVHKIFRNIDMRGVFFEDVGAV